MKNSIAIVVEKATDIHVDKVEKDFAGVLNQYEDYQKVKSSYYRLGGLGLFLLSIFITVATWQSGEETVTQSPALTNHPFVSAVTMGPLPLREESFPEIRLLNHTVKRDAPRMPQSIERESEEVVEQVHTEVQTKEELAPTSQQPINVIHQNSTAEPVAGFQDLYTYFSSNLSYPEALLADSVEGVVKVAFTVNTDSTISDLQVLQSLGTELDKEAIRLVEGMPRWKPAVENGITISSTFIIPVRFNIKRDE